jgi:hypothetical protein
MADKNIEISPQYLKALAEETRHTIREEAAKLINDDLAHAAHLRSIIVSASEHLQATSLKEAVLGCVDNQVSHITAAASATKEEKRSASLS